ncbi:MAG: hypothetical protein PF483_14245 [Halothiobacillus sp.]|jgi:hypothetical protein|nr:hypothetical protein [Halothiobacillus sp.]
MQIGVDCNLAVGNRRIFVVTSDEIARMAVQFMLHDEYETHEFGSLDASELKARDWPPDLLIVGAEFVSGGDAAELDPVLSRFPQARVLLLTDGAAEGPGEGQGEQGVVARLYTPLRLEAVRSTVANEFR